MKRLQRKLRLFHKHHTPLQRQLAVWAFCLTLAEFGLYRAICEREWAMESRTWMPVRKVTADELIAIIRRRLPSPWAKLHGPVDIVRQCL